MLINRYNCSLRNYNNLLFIRIENYYDWIMDNTRDAVYCKAPHYNEDIDIYDFPKCPVKRKPRAPDPPTTRKITRLTTLPSKIPKSELTVTSSKITEQITTLEEHDPFLPASAGDNVIKNNVIFNYLLIMMYSLLK